MLGVPDVDRDERSTLWTLKLPGIADGDEAVSREGVAENTCI